MHGTNPAHGGALLKLHTGSDTFVRPSMGAWVSYGLGTENTDLPAFLTICPTLAHGGVNNWGSAFLPAWCQGTPLGNASVSAEQAVVRHIKNPRTPTPLQRAAARPRLATSTTASRGRRGATRRSRPGSSPSSWPSACKARMPEMQGIEGETEATQKMYGLDDPVTANFGRQCLMARRFAERGVRFMQVTHSDSFVQWDQHGDLLKGHTKNAAEVDKPIAGLLARSPRTRPAR
jgi:hypothetical protein